MQVYHDQDAHLSLLEGKQIAVIGYGNQGRAQALNLRDSGLKVVIGTREDGYAERARQDGFAVLTIDAASAGADVVMVAPPYHRGRLEPSQVLDRDQLAAALRIRGVASVMPADDQDAAERLLEVIKPGDVVIGCSSGAFNAMHNKLIEALQRGEET